MECPFRILRATYRLCEQSAGFGGSKALVSPAEDPNRHCRNGKSPAGEFPLKSSGSSKSVGSFENFCDSYTVVCSKLFDSCMRSMWNDVLYNHVSEYSSAWRKRKRWSSPCLMVDSNIQTKSYANCSTNLSTEVVSFYAVFWGHFAVLVYPVLLTDL